MTLKQILEETAYRQSEKTAIIIGDDSLSYRELDEEVNKVANALLEMGISKGDRVAIILGNSTEYVVNYFAIAKIGAIVVLLDTYYKISELNSLFTDSLPKALVTDSNTIELLLPELSNLPAIDHIIEVGSAYRDRFHNYEEIVTTGSAQPIEAEPSPDDIVHIAYTSGPTFNPKGAAMSQGEVVKATIMMAKEYQMVEEDIMMLYALPMHHMFGLVVILLTSIYIGNKLVIVQGTGLSLTSFLTTIEQEKGTILMAVPYIYALINLTAENEGVNNNLCSLRICISAGAPLLPDIARQFKKYYGFDILDYWGLTEATCMVTGMPLDGTGKPGSVGRVIPGWEIKVIDDNEQELLPNQSGEIIVRGPIMKCYYNNPQATAEVIKGEWLFSGDIGRVDKDGYLFITGRKKEAIIVKGQNIYPNDIEQLLVTYPGVAEAAVIGIPDKIRGEVLGAAISLESGKTVTEQEIRQFCMERLASYKTPRQVIFLDSLPTTSSKRIDKDTLRKSLSIPSLF